MREKRTSGKGPATDSTAPERHLFGSTLDPTLPGLYGTTENAFSMPEDTYHPAAVEDIPASGKINVTPSSGKSHRYLRRLANDNEVDETKLYTAMSGKEERKAPEMTRKEKAARSRLRTKGEPIEGEFVLWLTIRMYSKVVKATPRFFFKIRRPPFDDRVHVAFITMFEETEATKASGHRGFRVMLYLGDNWGHFMINKGGGSDLRQHFYPGYVLKALSHSYVVGPPIKGVVEEWLQWKNKGELVKETVTARFHGFRMKAASDLLQLIDENVRIEELKKTTTTTISLYPTLWECLSQPYVATTSAT
eukprot:g19326.t1